MLLVVVVICSSRDDRNGICGSGVDVREGFRGSGRGGNDVVVFCGSSAGHRCRGGICGSGGGHRDGICGNFDDRHDGGTGGYGDCNRVGTRGNRCDHNRNDVDGGCDVMVVVVVLGVMMVVMSLSFGDCSGCRNVGLGCSDTGVSAAFLTMVVVVIVFVAFMSVMVLWYGRWLL